MAAEVEGVEGPTCPPQGVDGGRCRARHLWADDCDDAGWGAGGFNKPKSCCRLKKIKKKQVKYISF